MLFFFFLDLPSVEAPPQGKPEEHSSGKALRDFMLKNPYDVAPKDVDPSSSGGSSVPRSPFHDWKPFPRVRCAHLNFKSKAAFPRFKVNQQFLLVQDVNYSNMICIATKD